MATYPIKMLKDENNSPFVPLVGANAIIYNDTETLEEKLDKKLEKTNIIAGDNITLSVDGNNITINGGAGSSVTLVDNLTTSAAGQGALDAHQGYILKGMIDNLPRVIDDVTSTSQTDALSANQGRVLNINKQDKLISGTNLKTINNESLLGSGNITVSASPEISISTTTPSDDEVLWIDPTEDYINTASEVINSMAGNETSLAPSVNSVKGYLMNTLYPVGSVYVTNTNTNPSSQLGGTWTLTGKGFNDGATSSVDYITENSTNCTIDGKSYCRNGASIELRFHVTTKIALDDTTVELGTIDVSKLGLTQLSLNVYQHPCLSDGGNGLISVSINGTTGIVQSNDVIMKDASGSLPAGSAFYVHFTWVEHSNYMLDSACDKFYWERTA